MVLFKSSDYLIILMKSHVLILLKFKTSMVKIIIIGFFLELKIIFNIFTFILL